MTVSPLFSTSWAKGVLNFLISRLSSDVASNGRVLPNLRNLPPGMGKRGRRGDWPFWHHGDGGCETETVCVVVLPEENRKPAEPPRYSTGLCDLLKRACVVRSARIGEFVVHLPDCSHQLPNINVNRPFNAHVLIVLSNEGKQVGPIAQRAFIREKHEARTALEVE